MKTKEKWMKIKIISIILFFPICGLLIYWMFQNIPLKHDIFGSVEPLIIQIIVTFFAILSMLIGIIYLFELPKKFERSMKEE